MGRAMVMRTEMNLAAAPLDGADRADIDGRCGLLNAHKDWFSAIQ